MSLDEQVSQTLETGPEKMEEILATAAAAPASSSSSSSTTTEATDASADKEKDAAAAERERSEKLLQAKELYSHGSRNYLIKNYAEAADELSHVCALYADLYGDISDELGMPYLLYAKSLIALTLDENKVIDVPDEADDDEDDSAEEVSNGDLPATSTSNAQNCKETTTTTNNIKLKSIKKDVQKEADDSADSTANENVDKPNIESKAEAKESEVSSTNDAKIDVELKKIDNGAPSVVKSAIGPLVDDEKPSTSNGISNDEHVNPEEEDNETASNLQLAWEILETAAKIFGRQGANGLANLAEVQTELGNIQFENFILNAARDDYEKALKIYNELESQNYRRAMAEIHYKIGLSYLMEQLNKEGASSFKQACLLIQGEIEDIKEKKDLSEKDKNNIQDMEETKQEIEAKIVEIEEMQAQQIADVRAALDSYIKPIMSKSSDDTAVGPSSSTSASSATTSAVNAFSSTSSSSKAATTVKPNDITHLIKRKKPEDTGSEAEAATSSPAKRPAL